MKTSCQARYCSCFFPQFSNAIPININRLEDPSIPVGRMLYWGVSSLAFFSYFWPAKLSISLEPGLTIASDCTRSLDVGLEKCFMRRWERALRWVAAAELPSRLSLKGPVPHSLVRYIIRKVRWRNHWGTFIELGVGGGMDYEYQEQLYHDVRREKCLE